MKGRGMAATKKSVTQKSVTQKYIAFDKARPSYTSPYPYVTVPKSPSPYADMSREQIERYAEKIKRLAEEREPELEQRRSSAKQKAANAANAAKPRKHPEVTREVLIADCVDFEIEYGGTRGWMKAACIKFDMSPEAIANRMNTKK